MDRLVITSIEPWNLIVGAERLSAFASRVPPLRSHR